MRTLNLDMKNPGLKEEIEKDGGYITGCIQCGACMSICPVAISGFEFPNKRLFKLIILELEKEVLEHRSPWICISCQRCVHVCPRNVNPHSIYFALRRYQSKQFKHPRIFEDIVRSIYQYGYVIEPENSKRRELNLPEIKLDEEELDEIRMLMEDSRLRILGII
ncbi:4Fe-4S dicluster domain-containing protein [Geoglobus acetivorans]|uniref:CoB--CoM heterodisulfide reductase subunit C n=1 Tax=Geoglobus acetivorans TaxID=565033 RepID=A0A0A7GD48_GEOAI|nr:CoB--CoM heterodisulfide reductase subunit C [Geoglobus acetivorans]